MWHGTKHAMFAQIETFPNTRRTLHTHIYIYIYTHHRTDDKRQILFGSRLCGSFPSAAEHLKACGRILLRDGEVFARKRTRALESLPPPPGIGK